MSIKTILLMALGAALLVLLVIMWGGFAARITSLIETGVCSITSAPDDCRLRGAHLFLIWAVVGLVTLVAFGLIVERFIDKR